MKNTFAISMTLLLALTLGGSILGYRLGSAEHEEKPAAEGAVNPGQVGEGGSASGSGGETASASGVAAEGAAGNAEASATEAEGGTPDDSTETTPSAGTTANTGSGNETGSAGNTNLAGTVSSNPADGSLVASGPNAAQKGMQAAAAQGGNSEAGSAAAPATAGDAVEGKAVYVTSSCAGCHGANGEGGVGPNLQGADGPKSWTLEQFNVALRSGQSPAGPLKAPMPQYSPETLSDANVANIYAYIKTLN